MLYSEADERRWRISPSAHGIPVGETQAGKSSLPDDHPLQSRRGRRHRHGGRQRACGRGRRGARRRHAAAGFHHRLVGAVQEPGPPHHRAQRAALRRRQAPRAAAGRRRASRARRNSVAALQGWKAPCRLDRQCAPGEKALAGRGGRATPRPTNARLAVRRAGDRRGAARACGIRRGRAARPAACRANCTSSGRPGAPGYHHGIRLFVHGLRDRRRARRQDGATRSAKSS